MGSEPPLTTDPHDHSTFLTSVFGDDRAPSAPTPWRRLVVEAFITTGLGVWLAATLGFDQAGVFSIFLAAAGLAPRLQGILRANRDDILTHEIGSVAANRRTSIRMLALFGGMGLAFVGTALIIGEEASRSTFRFALEAAKLGDDTILTRSFGSFWGLFGHNLGVVLSFFVLAFLYRTYGALLALGWNACIWGLVLTFMVVRAVSGGGPPGAVIAAGLSIMPHLVCEGLGYILVSMAGMFLSKALTKYGFSDPNVREVGRASAIMIAIAIGLVLVGAGLEQALPALVAG